MGGVGFASRVLSASGTKARAIDHIHPPTWAWPTISTAPRHEGAELAGAGL